MLERHIGKTMPGKFFEQRGTEVSGKVLIYGGGGGVGSAVARILAQSGYGLYLTGRGDQKVKQ